jgi:hypothetical protein
MSRVEHLFDPEFFKRYSLERVAQTSSRIPYRNVMYCGSISVCVFVGIVIVVAVAKRDVPECYASCLEWATYRKKGANQWSMRRIKQDRNNLQFHFGKSKKSSPLTSYSSNRVVTSPYGRIAMVVSSRVATLGWYLLDSHEQYGCSRELGNYILASSWQPHMQDGTTLSIQVYG